MAIMMTNKDFEPKIVGFLCNWCSYAGADLAGTSRIQYPPNIRIIRVMCSGRVNPLFIAKSFQEGADGILVSGCHPGDCHYTEGNYFTRRRFNVMRSLLEYIGVDSRRFRMSWVSASEGGKFAEVIKQMTEELKELGPNTKFVREKI
jgi:coenzyme F420-reducing hydrogenase delta subunit